MDPPRGANVAHATPLSALVLTANSSNPGDHRSLRSVVGNVAKGVSSLDHALDATPTERSARALSQVWSVERLRGVERVKF